ncbi:MAG: serine hydrolase [bacterium]|nr:serine hydrolase [bacterium]
MTFRPLIVSALALTLLSCDGSPLPEVKQPGEATDEMTLATRAVAEYARRVMEEERLPGLAVGLTHRDGWVWTGAYGVADLKLATPLTTEHMFEIGSISKMFTALSLLGLRDEGRFDPRAPVTASLPWFEAGGDGGAITGHHLLSHTSGIVANRDDVVGSWYMAHALRERPSRLAPGERFAYSNVGYQVLHAMLETLEERSITEVFAERIFEPLGMTSSRAGFTTAMREHMAVGYQPLYDDRPPHRSHPQVEAPWGEYDIGDGNVVSTPADLAAFLRMLLNRGATPAGGRIVSEESFELFMNPPGVKALHSEKRHYGYGIFAVRTGEGHTRLSHGGGMVGYITALEGDLDTGMGAVAFTNAMSDAPFLITSYALDALHAAAAGEPIPDPLPPVDLMKVAEAADYAGSYREPGGDRVLEVTAEGEALFLSSPSWADGTRVQLESAGRGDGFLAHHPEIEGLDLFLLCFGRDDDERVVELYHGEDWYVGDGYDGPTVFEAPERWRAYRGHYRSYSPWLSNFRVVLRKGELLVFTAGSAESGVGFERLTEIEPGVFAVGEQPTPERLVFDSVVDGKALRAVWSGHPFYRFFTP